MLNPPAVQPTHPRLRGPRWLPAALYHALQVALAVALQGSVVLTLIGVSQHAGREGNPLMAPVLASPVGPALIAGIHLAVTWSVIACSAYCRRLGVHDRAAAWAGWGLLLVATCASALDCGHDLLVIAPLLPTLLR